MMPILVFYMDYLRQNKIGNTLSENLKKSTTLFLTILSVFRSAYFHGEQTNYHIEDFEQSAQYLSRQITAKIADKPYILVGYSLGGRLALNYALQSKYPQSKLVALILEGANLGLENEQQRLERWQNDLAWAKRFSQEKLCPRF